ncbi:MAG: hypothetical protein ACFFD2_06200 [Promethearchaeota archaeon]
MPLKCSLCSREIDTLIKFIAFHCDKCNPPQIYCSICGRDQLPRKGIRKKLLCIQCQKPVRLVKNFEKLPKKLKKLALEKDSGFTTEPEIQIVEDTEFIQSYRQFCANCGLQLIKEAQWCPECGKKVE